MKKYSITKKQSQEQIDKYKNVCRSCGGKLTPLETVDNSGNPTFWCGCESCQVFDNGVKIEIFKVAKEMVTKRNYRHYHHDPEPDKETDPDMFNYWRRTQIRGTCDVVHDVIKCYHNLT